MPKIHALAPGSTRRHTPGVNRRLRLALLLVALAAAGPLAAPAQSAGRMRATFSRAWLDAERVRIPELRGANPASLARLAARLTFVSPHSFRPAAVHPYPLFQRPPPTTV